MAKKVGLPDFVKSKYDNHLVDEITERTRTAIIRSIPIGKLTANTMQPRKDLGELAELADSIREKGILEPILVRPKNGKFEIIAGERRFRAAELAELSELPCIEYDVPDNEALELSIIENIQRKDLNIFEQAYSLKSLSDIYGYTHQDIAQKIAKSRVTVTELLRITDLPPNVVTQCFELNINSKTFLLELVKLESQDEMLEVLAEYAEKPFSRDKIKQQRKEKEETDSDTEKKTSKSLKFHFASDDQKVKIKFDIRHENPSKDKLIEILERVIADIRADRISELNKLSNSHTERDN